MAWKGCTEGSLPAATSRSASEASLCGENVGCLVGPCVAEKHGVACLHEEKRGGKGVRYGHEHCH
jgi:hypothetical protein